MKRNLTKLTFSIIGILALTGCEEYRVLSYKEAREVVQKIYHVIGRDEGHKIPEQFASTFKVDYSLLITNEAGDEVSSDFSNANSFVQFDAKNALSYVTWSHHSMVEDVEDEFEFVGYLYCDNDYYYSAFSSNNGDPVFCKFEKSETSKIEIAVETFREYAQLASNFDGICTASISNLLTYSSDFAHDAANSQEGHTLKTLFKSHGDGHIRLDANEKYKINDFNLTVRDYYEIEEYVPVRVINNRNETHYVDEYKVHEIDKVDFNLYQSPISTLKKLPNLEEFTEVSFEDIFE